MLYVIETGDALLQEVNRSAYRGGQPMKHGGLIADITEGVIRHEPASERDAASTGIIRFQRMYCSPGG